MKDARQILRIHKGTREWFTKLMKMNKTRTDFTEDTYFFGTSSHFRTEESLSDPFAGYSKILCEHTEFGLGGKMIR